MTKNLRSSNNYFEGKKLKGDGAGTEAGWYMSKIPEFTDLSTQVMNLSNNCNFGYYYKALGAATQSISGAMDMTISLLFRAFMDDNTDLNTGIADSDDTVVGTWTGVFIKSFFQVEIPAADLELGGMYENTSTLVLGF